MKQSLRLVVALLFFIPLTFVLLHFFKALSLIIADPANFQIFWSDYVYHSSLLSFKITLLSLFVSLVLVFLCGYAIFRLKNRRVHFFLSFFLSVPHLAFFSGTLFLIMSSGFFSRALYAVTGMDLSRYLGWESDPGGLSFAITLALKESLFLIFASLDKIEDGIFGKYQNISQSYGYNSFTAWVYLIWPRILHSIRYPIWMVLAYSMSVVDLSLSLGPTNPPSFSVVLWEYFGSSSLDSQMKSQMGSLHILFLLVSAIAFYEICFYLFQKISLLSLKWKVLDFKFISPRTILNSYFSLQLLPILILLLWAFSAEWVFPHIFPQILTTHNIFQELEVIGPHILTTLSLGLISSLVSIVICLFWFEWDSGAVSQPITLGFLLVPVFPMLPLLYGFNIFIIETQNYLSSYFAVLYVHIFLILPYTYLMLKDSFIKFDKRIKNVGLSLNSSTFKFFFNVRLSSLKGVIATTFSIAFAVSVSQYLATVMIGGGRVETLTTDAVVAVIGQNRKLTAVNGLFQILLPLTVFFISQRLSKRMRRDA